MMMSKVDQKELREQPTRTDARLLYLDGLRGLAAMQVVIGHYAGVFLRGFGLPNGGPVIGGIKLAWLKAPLFFLNDGFFAVYIFFMISGTVLTIAFQRNRSTNLSLLGQRFVRLGGPMLAALLLSAGFLGLIPQAHIEAADVIGPTSSLKAVLHAPYTIYEALRQAATTGMIVGYREASIFPDFFRTFFWDDSNNQSLDPPLWTIHFEFWGSIFVIFLVNLRRVLPNKLYLMTLCLISIVLIRHTFIAFVIGHMFAIAIQHEDWTRVKMSMHWRVVGIAACVAAVWACEIPAWPWVATLYDLPGPLKVYSDVNLQNLLAAFFGFSGVLLVSNLHWILESDLTQRLGRLSFSIYLVHFPILFSFVPLFFIHLQFLQSYDIEALTSTISGIILTLVVAIVFEKSIDRLFIKMSRLLRITSATKDVDMARAI